MEVKFIACKYLDFDDHYTAKKEPINSFDGLKICWNRSVIDPSFPKLVQFCKKRGRLNDPESCLCETNKICSDYEDCEHTVTFEEDVK